MVRKLLATMMMAFALVAMGVGVGTALWTTPASADCSGRC